MPALVKQDNMIVDKHLHSRVSAPQIVGTHYIEIAGFEHIQFEDLLLVGIAVVHSTVVAAVVAGIEGDT